MENIFDKNTFSMNDYPFSPSSKKVLDDIKRTRKTGGMVFFAGVIILLLLSTSLNISSEQIYCYLGLLYTIFMGYLNITKNLNNKKAIQLSLPERFDLYLYQYHDPAKKNSRHHDKFLLYMAKEDITAGNYDRAAMALGYINPSTLKGYFKKLYNIITYSVALRCSDFATAEKMFNEYAQNKVSANRTFPEAAEVWNWRNSFSPEHISNTIGNINSLNMDAGVWPSVLNTLAFALWFIALSYNRLQSVPLTTSNVAITYSFIMALTTFLCFLSLVVLLAIHKNFFEKSKKIFYACIISGYLILALSWLFKAIKFLGEWLYLWM